MLFINNEHISLDSKNTNNPYAKEILAKFEEIRRDYTFPIRIKTRFGTRINKTGAKEPTQSIVALFEGDYYTETGVKVRMRYSKTFPKKTASGRIDYVEGSGEIVERHMVISDKEMDKAYYMLYVCPIVKKGLLKVENKQKEAASHLKNLSRMAVVNYFLTDEESELFHDHDRIRTIALSFGVPKADDKKLSIEEVKLRLIENIAKGENSNDPIINIKAFREATNLPVLVQRRATIQKAVDKGVLKFDTNKWRWVLKVGDVDRAILEVNVQDYGVKEDLLVRHFISNDDHRSLFDKAMGQEGAFAGKAKLTAEEIDAMGMPELKTRCAEAKLPYMGAGLTKDVLQNNLKEHYGVA